MKKNKKPLPKQSKEEIRKELTEFLSGYDINFERQPGGEDYRPPSSRRSSVVTSYRDSKFLPKGASASYRKSVKEEEEEEDIALGVKNKLRVAEKFKNNNIARIEKSENKFLQRSDKKINTLESSLEKAKREKTRDNINKKMADEVAKTLKKVNQYGEKKNIVLKKYQLKKELAHY